MNNEMLLAAEARINASAQQIIESATAAAELTGESVADVLTEQLSGDPAVLEIVLHTLRLPA